MLLYWKLILKSLFFFSFLLSLMYWFFPELGLPANNQGWPEDFGFKLGGDGPSYILSVVEGSSAYMAGLQPGDQVLEIDGQNVSSLSTKALIALAQTLKTVPPSIGVVSRIEQASFSSLTCHFNCLITKQTWIQFHLT